MSVNLTQSLVQKLGSSTPFDFTNGNELTPAAEFPRTIRGL
jgi:hypothetical protein